MHQHPRDRAVLATARVKDLGRHVECEVGLVEEEGGGVWGNGRQAGGFSRLFGSAAGFHFRHLGAGASVFGAVGERGDGFVARVGGVDVVCGGEGGREDEEGGGI